MTLHDDAVLVLKSYEDQEEVRQTEKIQGPGQGQEKINQREGIKGEGVPLSEVRKAAVAQVVPNGEFSSPEAFTMITGQRITKAAKVAKEKGLVPEQNARKEGKDEQCQQDREPLSIQPGAIRGHGRSSSLRSKEAGYAFDGVFHHEITAD